MKRTQRRPGAAASPREAVRPYLYHVTYAGLLGSIDEQGLRAGGGGSMGQFPGYTSHSTGRLFVCERDNVYGWYNKAEEFADYNADSYGCIEEESVPVVLRFSRRLYDSKLVDDPQGRHGDYYIADGVVAPELLTVWDGEIWSPELSVDAEQALEEVTLDGEDYEDYDGPIPCYRFRSDNPLNLEP